MRSEWEAYAACAAVVIRWTYVATTARKCVIGKPANLPDQTLNGAYEYFGVTRPSTAETGASSVVRRGIRVGGLGRCRGDFGSM